VPFSFINNGPPLKIVYLYEGHGVNINTSIQ